jgi:hypothetical protein
MKLGDVATIRLGVSLRSKLAADPGGPVAVIQAKDLPDGGSLRESEILRTFEIDPTPEQLVQPGDLVMQSRGLHYKVAVVERPIPHCVAASPLYVVRPKKGVVDPHFIAFLLRRVETQAVLRRLAAGTHVPQFTREALSELYLPVPSMPIQRDIAYAAGLIEKEQQIVSKLCDLRLTLLYTRLTPEGGAAAELR